MSSIFVLLLIYDYEDTILTWEDLYTTYETSLNCFLWEK